tara:strand:- start:412 stop:1179 length:768 start_codon:yes stop_codon:yes gene_type:complete
MNKTEFKKAFIEANLRSKNIERFLDPNREEYKNSQGIGMLKYSELMNKYSLNEIQKMVDDRFLNDVIVQKIYNEYNLKDAECVVDMGSGCCLFEGRGIKNLINLDLNPYPNVNLLNNMRRTQLKDNVADRIICLGSHIWDFRFLFYHKDRTDVNEEYADCKVLDEIYRIAKPGCIMLSYCNSITLWQYIDNKNGLPYDKNRIIEWIHNKHEVAESPIFTPKRNTNKKKVRSELNSRGHNRRVGIAKDKIFWAWIL